MEWRNVVGYEGLYEVSDSGLVRRVDGSPRSHAKGEYLRQGTVERGYRTVWLYREGQRRTVRVHIIVARAFLGEPLPGQEVCHSSGVTGDNRASNLRWDSHAGNAGDTVRHGRHNMARKTHCLRGHEFTTENTLVRTTRTGLGRRCRTCMRLRNERKA